MARRHWWQRPTLRVGAEEERRVSWLELFYDLVYVLVVAELAHYLTDHVSLDGVLTYLLLFVAMWWTWIGGTFYNERFESEDIGYRVSVFLKMLPVAAMAVFAHAGTSHLAVEFALSYVAVRLFTIILWIRAGWHTPVFRPISDRYMLGFGASVLLWTASVFVAPPLRFVLWCIGLLFDLLTPLTTTAFLKQLPQSRFSKLPERFGLFIIIVLGEAFVGVVGGLSDHESFTLQLGVLGVLAMALVFGLWWIYFDFVGRRQGARPSLGWQFLWNYSHMPLAAALAAMGAALQDVLAHDGAMEMGVAPLLVGAVAVAHTTIALIETASRREHDEPTHDALSPGLKYLTGLFALGVGAFSASLGSVLLLVVLILLNLVHMAYGLYVWYR